MPVPEGTVFESPEAMVLDFGDGQSFDVGSFCYRTRSAVVGARKEAKGRPKSERLVDVSTFELERADGVRKLIDHFSGMINADGKRPATAAHALYNYLRFIVVAEEKGYQNVLIDQTSVVPAFRVFVEHLRERINLGEIKNNPATVAQNTVLTALTAITETEGIGHGINLLRIVKAATEPTQPPPEEVQSRVLGICQSIFDGLSELCLEFRSYPYPLPIPAHLQAPQNVLWVFPTQKWCMAPCEMERRDSMKYGYWAYDYANGCLATVADIANRYAYNPKKGRKDTPAELAIKHAKAGIESANKDKQDRFRRRAAILAQNAFVVLFLSRTGMNWEQVRDLPWADDEVEPEAERQGYRQIKYRAGGREVSFEIQTNFLGLFRKYLRLRRYLLNHTPYGYLFMTVDSGDTTQIERLSVKALTSVFDSFRRIDPMLESVKAKGWRAGKSDFLLRNTDIETTASILQNSVDTVIRSYAAGSPVTQQDEFGAFFEGLHSAVIAKDEEIKNGVENAVGLCSKFGFPHAVSDAPVKPDCHNKEGCLFCDKYKVHADDRDVRKLVSCRYCIQQTAHLANDEEQFQRLFTPIFNRIAELLDEIDAREPGIVDRITNEVEEGELDPYWARKLEMLIDLEWAL